MAGHGVRVTYQHFSLQERMAPLQMMKEEYDKVNEGLADLGLTANQMSQYIDPSSRAGQKVAAYNKALEDAATTLSSQGLKGLSRTALYNLKRTYQSQIAPINEGAKNYAALQAQIKEMQWKDPTIMVNGMPTLDQYIENPNALPNVISGAQLMQAGATAALTLPNVTYDQLSRYMRGDKNAIPDLDRAVQDIARSYGVSTNQALGYIQRGVQTGLGERTTKWDMARQEYDYKHALDMEKERYEQQQLNSRHYSSLAQNQQQLIAGMQREGWGWDPALNNGKGGFYQDEDTLKDARQAALASAGYSSDAVFDGSNGSPTSRRTGNGTQVNQLNTVPGSLTYDGEGVLLPMQPQSPIGEPVGDILQANTDVQALALKHAQVHLGDDVRTPNGYDPDEIDRLVRENIDLLRQYAFYVERNGRHNSISRFTGVNMSHDSTRTGSPAARVVEEDNGENRR